MGLAVLAVLVAAGYGYIRYRWSQIQTAACSFCTAAGDGAFNVLVIGSDSRSGDTGQAAQQFGTSQEVSGQRSDTIKIVHVDPATGSASILSIPRDTFVQMPEALDSQGLGGDQKINTAFNDGANTLVETIEDTFGIPISHFVVVDFDAVINTVDTIGGIYLDFPFPVRDDDDGVNNAGLNITTTGCQKLDGAQTLALSRSRYYQYYDNGEWIADPTSDLGRIERQNVIIEALMSRARSTYDPFTLNAFLGAVVHDIVVDKGMSFGDMLSLVTRYHAFSPSSLETYTLPTVPETSASAGDVEVVEQPQAEQMLNRFLGMAPGAVQTPPVDAYGSPVYPPASSGGTSSSASASSGSAPSSGTSSTSASTSVPSYDPTVCSL